MLFLSDESDIIMIIDIPGTGKSTTITKMVENLLHGYVLRLGTTGTSAFVVAGATCHSALHLPINIKFQPLQRSALRNFRECFFGRKMIIINEVCIMGRNMLVQIEKRVRQDFGR